MASINEDNFPIIRVHFHGIRTHAEMEAYRAKWDEWLDRGEKFGLIVIQTGTNEQDQPMSEGEQLLKGTAIAEERNVQRAWGEQRKSQIEALCVGMATLDPEEEFKALYATAPQYIRETYYCDGAFFKTDAEAKQWLQQRL
jgi:hypothetical protein